MHIYISCIIFFIKHQLRLIALGVFVVFVSWIDVMQKKTHACASFFFCNRMILRIRLATTFELFELMETFQSNLHNWRCVTSSCHHRWVVEVTRKKKSHRWRKGLPNASNKQVRNVRCVSHKNNNDVWQEPI